MQVLGHRWPSLLSEFQASGRPYLKNMNKSRQPPEEKTLETYIHTPHMCGNTDAHTENFHLLPHISASQKVEIMYLVGRNCGGLNEKVSKGP